MLCKCGTGRVVPLFDLTMSRVESLGFWRGAVGELEMWHVRDKIVVTSRAGFHNPENAGIACIIFVLEDGAKVQIFGMPIADFDVSRRPSHSWRFAMPRDVSPEIYALFHDPFFTFVARDLKFTQACKKS